MLNYSIARYLKLLGSDITNPRSHRPIDLSKQDTVDNSPRDCGFPSTLVSPYQSHRLPPIATLPPPVHDLHTALPHLGVRYTVCQQTMYPL